MNDRLKGALCGVIGAAAYGTNPLFAKPLYATGLDATSVVFYRYLTAVIMVFILAKFQRVSLKLTRGECITGIMLGMLVVGSSLALFHSYNYMSVGIASTILFVYPVMVAIIMAVFFKERLSFTTIFCIVLSMVGIALLYKKEDGTTLSLIGTVMALISAATYAIYMVGVNKSRFRTVHPMAATFYILLFGMSIFFIFFLFGYHIKPLEQPKQLALLCGSGLIPTVISFVLTTMSIRRVGSTAASILGAFEPVTAVIIGIFVFSEDLTVRVFCGIIMVLCSVVIIIWGGKNKK